MWVCRICKESIDNTNDRCTTCHMPKDSTEHLVVKIHEPNTEDHLRLSIGDVISVFRKEGDTWRGKVGIEEGWFPKTCVDDKIIKREKYRLIKSVNDENICHLKLDEGNLVTVINRKGSGDVWVVSGCQGGWIPETYLEKVISEKVLPQIAPRPIKQPQESWKESVQDTLQRSTDLQKFRVLYDYANDDIKIAEGDIVVIVRVEMNGWLLAQIGHEKGLVPATYVQHLENQDEEICCVTALYSGEEIRDLTLQIGDVIKVVNRRKSGWVWVRHIQTEGWYPENYLKQIDDFSEIGLAAKVQENTGYTKLSDDYMNLEKGRASQVQENTGFTKLSDDYMNLEKDTPPVIPKRSKTVKYNEEHVKNPTKSTYGNITEHSYGNTENISEPSNIFLGQKSAGIGIGDLIKRQSDVQTVEGCSDEPTSKPPILLERRTKAEATTTYGNTDYHVDEPTSKPPILPERRTTAEATNTYGNTDYNVDEPTSKPPILPERRKKAEATNTYGNTDYHVDDIKKASLELMEYEEPKQRSRSIDKDEEKLESSCHMYDYILDKDETYTESILKRQPAESRITELSEKPALPKRPPPPSRPPPPQSEEKTRICNDDDPVQMATLYGRRKENEIRFVMVGRTGSGKSATGNTIMAKSEHFESKIAGGSVTRECKRGECSLAGRKIVVVDTPGLFDTQVPFEQISKEIIRCVNMSTPGPHAFLIVIQIARFTNEEIETLNRLFDLFGVKMGHFAIIIFTKLDDLEREKTTIESYIKMAPAKLKEFLERCQCRFLAIDNTSSEKKKTAKVKDLIQLVDSIVNENGGKCYTNAMYKEAEAALQRKVKEVEEEKAREKKKEIDQIQSKFDQQIDSIKKDNIKLAKEVSSKQISQRQFQRDKEKAQQEINRMKEEIKKIDMKRNQEIYLSKKREKEEKERQARDFEQKEKQQMQLLKKMQQQQEDMNRRQQEMERQKDTQLLKVTEDNNKKMEAEIQRIVDGSNEKYQTMMKALDATEKANEKLQEQIAQQNSTMQEIMREKNREFLKQQDEYRKRIEEEKERSDETLRIQRDELKRSIELQEQMAQQKLTMQETMREKDREFFLKQQDEYKKSIEQEKERSDETLRIQRDELKRSIELQEQMAQQKLTMQETMREKDREFFLKQQDEYKKSIEQEKERSDETLRIQRDEQKRLLDTTMDTILLEQREKDQRQRKEYQELKLKHETLQEEVKNKGCVLS